NVSEVLSLIAPPKRENLGGSYSFFVSEDFPKGLRADQLPEALSWLTANDDAPVMQWYHARDMADKIVGRACESIDEPHVLEKLFLRDARTSRLNACGNADKCSISHAFQEGFRGDRTRIFSRYSTSQRLSGWAKTSREEA